MQQKIKRFTIEMREAGISYDDMANMLERIAIMLREGYQAGEFTANDVRGWWDTETA